jgi:para-aminobenzoate synthetase component 2
MILLLDNHDSFTWNLAELLRVCSKVKVIIRTPEQLLMHELPDFNRIIFSPGPGLPHEQPGMFQILSWIEKQQDQYRRATPVFGVCLGMQAIATHFGGTLYNLPAVVHGQPRKLKILQQQHPLFAGVTLECEVGLYHSWAVQADNLPGCLEILATTGDGTVMALAHRTLPVLGVQFHPESIMTPGGRRMMENWLGA